MTSEFFERTNLAFSQVTPHSAVRPIPSDCAPCTFGEDWGYQAYQVPQEVWKHEGKGKRCVFSKEDRQNVDL